MESKLDRALLLAKPGWRRMLWGPQSYFCLPLISIRTQITSPFGQRRVSDTKLVETSCVLSRTVSVLAI